MRKPRIRRDRRPGGVDGQPGVSRPADPRAGEMLTGYLTREEDSRPTRWAGVAAIVLHFVLFLVVFPAARQEAVRVTSRNAATVIQRYTPPSPPVQARKTRKKATEPVPIPDPTPHEPEPIHDEASDLEFGEPDTQFVVGLPDAPPGPPGARAGAVSAGTGGLIPPVILERVLPEYTAGATRGGIQGDVYIEAVITVDGQVIEPRLLHGLADDELNQRALVAVQQWRFKPGLKDGRPVPVLATFEVNFRIH